MIKRLAGDEAAFLKAHAPGPWKITMPGPMSAAASSTVPASPTRSTRREDFIDEIVEMLKREVAALIAEGFSYIQLDSLHYVERLTYDVDTRPHDRRMARTPTHTSTSSSLSTTPCSTGPSSGGVTVGHAHVPRQQPQRLARRGQLRGHRREGVQPAQRRPLPARVRHRPRRRLRAAALHAEEQDGRPRPDQLQRAAPWSPVDDLRRRIDEAAKYVPIENLAISPQCGFASTAMGNLLTWDEQRRKLELIVETAQKVWG